MFVTHAGAFIMLAALTAFLNLRRNRAQFVAYLFGCALAPAAVLAYLLEQHTLFAAFDDVILYTATHYTSVNNVPFGFDAATINRPLKYAFGLAALLTPIVCAFDWPAWFSDRRLRLCIALALAGFLGCYPRPDMNHIAQSAPFALPLLAFCMTRADPILASRLSLRGRFQGRVRQVLATQIVPTPRGNVALFGQSTAHRGLPELLAAIAATPPGDAYFFYPYDAMLPFLSGREQVSKYDLFQPVYTAPAQYQETCRSAMRLGSSSTGIGKDLFPSMADAKPRERARFEQALDSAFELIPSTGTFEWHRRREGVSDSVCDGIAGELGPLSAAIPFPPTFGRSSNRTNLFAPTRPRPRKPLPQQQRRKPVLFRAMLYRFRGRGKFKRSDILASFVPPAPMLG
jgi:hypothetical protein